MHNVCLTQTGRQNWHFTPDKHQSNAFFVMPIVYTGYWCLVHLQIQYRNNAYHYAGNFLIATYDMERDTNYGANAEH